MPRSMCTRPRPFSHQNRSSQTNMTYLIAKILAYTYCVADRRLETRKPKPAWNQLFRQVQSRYISCNWSHLHLQASSSPELENSFRAFVEREKEIRSANKHQKNWSNACQLGFEFVKTANIYAVDHNSGAANGNIVQNHLNKALDKGIFLSP